MKTGCILSFPEIVLLWNLEKYCRREPHSEQFGSGDNPLAMMSVWRSNHCWGQDKGGIFHMHTNSSTRNNVRWLEKQICENGEYMNWRSSIWRCVSQTEWTCVFDTNTLEIFKWTICALSPFGLYLLASIIVTGHRLSIQIYPKHLCQIHWCQQWSHL